MKTRSISRKENNPIVAVLNTPELIYHIVRCLIDVDTMDNIPPLCLVSKQFRNVMTSDFLWRILCARRWITKWGFKMRWDIANEQFIEWMGNRSSEGESIFWRPKYMSEELDSKRNTIAPHELQKLMFDFRFWIGQPTVIDGRIVVQSGLLESVTKGLQFEYTRGEQHEHNEMWSAKGVVLGHPLGTKRIEWLLQERTGVIKWGIAPNFWPEACIRRLDSWGWEIRNRNVVMRALDPDFLMKYDKKNQFIVGRNGQSTQPLEERYDYNLWRDLLDEVQNVPLRNNPMVNGFLVMAEIPRSYLQHYVL